MIDSFLNEISQVAKCAEVKRKRDQLQQQVDAAKRNPSSSADYDRVSRLGIALKAAAQEVHQLQLPREIYLALADRHAELVARVDARCKELLQTDDFEALERLAKKLSALQALDVSELPRPAPSNPAAPLFSSTTTRSPPAGPSFAAHAPKDSLFPPPAAPVVNPVSTGTEDGFNDPMQPPEPNRVARDGSSTSATQSTATARVVMLPPVLGTSSPAGTATQEIALQEASGKRVVTGLSGPRSAPPAAASTKCIGGPRVAAVGERAVAPAKKQAGWEGTKGAEREREEYMDDPVMPPGEEFGEGEQGEFIDDPVMPPDDILELLAREGSANCNE